MIAKFSTVYFIIDALDECQERDGPRTLFWDQIKALQPLVSLLVTSRPIESAGYGLEGATVLEISARDLDIQTYLQGRIWDDRRLSSHVKADASLQDTIIQTITHNARGMYVFYLYILISHFPLRVLLEVLVEKRVSFRFN